MKNNEQLNDMKMEEEDKESNEQDELVESNLNELAQMTQLL